jgi:hypothetical protein
MATPRRQIDDEYVIVLNGVAGPAVRAAFADLELSALYDTTVVRGIQPDRAALHGVLDRIQDLGLEVIEVRREPPTGRHEV